MLDRKQLTFIGHNVREYNRQCALRPHDPIQGFPHVGFALWHLHWRVCTGGSALSRLRGGRLTFEIRSMSFGDPLSLQSGLNSNSNGISTVTRA